MSVNFKVKVLNKVNCIKVNYINPQFLIYRFYIFLMS